VLALVSRLLTALGHEAIVANPRKLRAIYANEDKTDQVDAEYLARVGHADPTLLRGIRHRGEPAQADLAVVWARNALPPRQTGPRSTITPQAPQAECRQRGSPLMAYRCRRSSEEDI
jgi:hypothetical protein